MVDKNTYPETDPRHHTQNVKGMLTDVMHHLREDIDKFDEPQAAAMFETSAEVLQGLITAFEHYEEQNEAAWQQH